MISKHINHHPKKTKIRKIKKIDLIEKEKFFSLMIIIINNISNYIMNNNKLFIIFINFHRHYHQEVHF